jgi:hypothetical protein
MVHSAFDMKIQTKKTHLIASEIGFLPRIEPSFTICAQLSNLQYGVARVKECGFCGFCVSH